MSSKSVEKRATYRLLPKRKRGVVPALVRFDRVPANDGVLFIANLLNLHDWKLLLFHPSSNTNIVNASCMLFVLIAQLAGLPVEGVRVRDAGTLDISETPVGNICSLWQRLQPVEISEWADRAYLCG